MTERSVRVSDREGDPRFSITLGDAVRAIEETGVPYLVFGSIAATSFGRPGPTEDVDFLVGRPDATTALDALSRAGFETTIDNPNWLYKASRDGVDIDLIFLVKGELHLDEEMLQRAVVRPFAGRHLRMVSAEDSLVIEAVSNDAQVPEHWENAVAILAGNRIDWAYLLRRAKFAPKRILSLLIYGQSSDLAVPDHIIRRLYADAYGA